MTTYHCMLAKPYDPAKVKSWPVLVEPKMDGVRVLVKIEADGTVGFFSRTMKTFTSFDHLIPAIQDEAGAWGLPFPLIIDCEAVSETFNKAISQVRKKGVPCLDVKLLAFDLFVPGEGNAKSYDDRCAELNSVTSCSDVFQEIENSMCRTNDDVMDAYREYRECGFEGAMVKDIDAHYELKRSVAWMKIKDKLSVDVPVTGAFEGQGKHAGKLGGLIVDVGGIECRVGTGLSDQQREEFWKAYLTEGYLGKDKLVGRLVEVEYHEKTPAGSLRHPRFIRFRDDKQEAAQ